MEIKIRIAAMAAGFILDLCLGDPYCLPHPVRAIGRLISGLETGIRKRLPANDSGERAGGLLLTALVLLIVGSTFTLLSYTARMAGRIPDFLMQTVLCYYVLAARSLCSESMKVCRALEAGDVEKARTNVSMIVGRDTAALTDVGIAKAAVETVAENTSDGVIAPLFYLALGGPVLSWIYKAVNTMDSMVGYKNERYLYFGWAAARLDDILNLIPSRLSACLMIIASALLGLNAKGALKIYIRDRHNHKSPNSAQTEAVCAGALSVQLAGDAWYFGVRHEKPVIGDALREVVYTDIRRADRLMYLTAVLCLLLVSGILLILS